MRRLLMYFIGLIILVTIGGAIFLMQWDIPAPSAPVEKTIPDDRFEQ